MIVVDVETTGTDSNVHSLLSIGAVDFDDPTREFFEECRAFDGAKVEKEATEINGVGEKEAFDTSKQTDEQLIKNFFSWMKQSKDHTIAGQNPHFDTGFIIATALRYHLDFSVPKRIVDLHSVAWAHMILHGINPPIEHNRSGLNSDTIMEYVGIPAEVHPHIAINGARIEAEAFSRLLHNKPFYKSYSNYEVKWK